ncbi:5'-AMP-activated protein kinase subunit gamma-2 [Clonorchis sinensis]|uniref:5'-AMP-activated protein kinase subunit gamma-2 n=2 Tax=Clonorchis sinensis TaxID=79923 RepID=A0A8T1MUF6_CLOSI|nr:5'-AMP-activated protein kinase subunit gamma-2 [Clonorchis sinensis]
MYGSKRLVPKLAIDRQQVQSSNNQNINCPKSCLIFRDQHSASTSMLTVESFEPEKRAHYYFFKHHTCYDLLPGSAKLILLDSELSIKKAFYALIYNNVRAAILWSSSHQAFVGMLTVTDFINVLVKTYNAEQYKMEDFERASILEWRSYDTKTSAHPLVSVSPESSLLEAARMLIKCRFHRLPVIDPVFGNPLHILTHKRILKYAHLNRHSLSKAPYLCQTLEELSLGTYASEVHVIRTDTTVIAALHLFLRHQISCLPVIDEHGRLTDLYSKFDVFNLAVTRSYNRLDITVYDALAFHRSNRQRYPIPLTCHKTDTLGTVIERVVKSGVHRLVVVDDDNFVQGIISLSDILRYLISKPLSRNGLSTVSASSFTSAFS